MFEKNVITMIGMGSSKCEKSLIKINVFHSVGTGLCARGFRRVYSLLDHTNVSYEYVNQGTHTHVRHINIQITGTVFALSLSTSNALK